jgi:cellulose synthase/poly-beta-1,6-N-acetylglucosamine synthase-like glycosyltransferase
MVLLINIAMILETVLFILLSLTSVYLFVFGTAGVFRYRPASAKETMKRRIAILIPGYKEDQVILETARESLLQDYPGDLFDVYIIADSFGRDTIEKLKELEVRVIEVSFDKSSKAKALNKAMQEISDNYDVAVILDADNIMAPGFLDQVNNSFDRGFAAVQGHRTAKNINTRFAILDAISEEINNHIFRKGHRVLGISSALIGSGMAFEYATFKKIMAGVSAHGEDKELEMHLLMSGIKIEYLPAALVYDEKIQQVTVFARQRKRWLSAQFVNLRQYFGSGIKLFFTKGNIDIFDKLIQMVLPPRLLHLGIVTLLFLATLILDFILPSRSLFSIPLSMYAALWLITWFSILISVPRKFYSKDTFIALKALPGAFIIMFGLLFRLRGADKSFIHTPHGTIESNKIL